MKETPLAEPRDEEPSDDAPTRDWIMPPGEGGRSPDERKENPHVLGELCFTWQKED